MFVVYFSNCFIFVFILIFFVCIFYYFIEFLIFKEVIIVVGVVVGLFGFVVVLFVVVVVVVIYKYCNKFNVIGVVILLFVSDNVLGFGWGFFIKFFIFVEEIKGLVFLGKYYFFKLSYYCIKGFDLLVFIRIFRWRWCNGYYIGF